MLPGPLAVGDALWRTAPLPICLHAQEPGPLPTVPLLVWLFRGSDAVFPKSQMAVLFTKLLKMNITYTNKDH